MRIKIEKDTRELTAKTLGALIDEGAPEMIIKYYALQKKSGSNWATVQVYPNMQELDVDVDGVNYKWVQTTETYPLVANSYPVLYYRGRYSVFTSTELANYIADYFMENEIGIAREYLAHRYHYDPLANYDRHEHYNEKTTDAYGHVITTNYNSTDTSTKNLTDELTNGLVQTRVDTGSEKDDVKEYVTGYNAPSTETLNSHTENTTTFSNRTNTSTNSGKDTTKHTGTDTNAKTGTDADTHSGSDIETKVTDNHLIGNIGTTMTQDMIERDLSLGARNVLQEIFYNCIKDISFIA